MPVLASVWYVEHAIQQKAPHTGQGALQEHECVRICASALPRLSQPQDWMLASEWITFVLPFHPEAAHQEVSKQGEGCEGIKIITRDHKSNIHGWVGHRETWKGGEGGCHVRQGWRVPQGERKPQRKGTTWHHQAANICLCFLESQQTDLIHFCPSDNNGTVNSAKNAFIVVQRQWQTTK